MILLTGGFPPSMLYIIAGAGILSLICFILLAWYGLKVRFKKKQFHELNTFIKIMQYLMYLVLISIASFIAFYIFIFVLGGIYKIFQ